MNHRSMRHLASGVATCSAAAALSLLLAGPVAEREATEDRPVGAWSALMVKCDANKDGKLSKDELKGYHPYFDLFDTNKDGVVTRAEAQAVLQKRPRFHPEFDRLKFDENGKVTLAQWNAARILVFEQMDANHDGLIDKGEFLAHHARNPKGPGLD
jgi:hypothetical protein